MTTSLYLGTWNVGPGSINDAYMLLKSAHALALQEASDQSVMLNRLEDSGYGVYRGEGEPGQAATPLVYNREFLKPLDRGWFCEPMTARTKVGKAGAGPSTLKAKWVVGGLFRHLPSRRIVAIGSTHVVPSVYLPTRRRLAREHIHNLSHSFAGFRGLVFVMGDFNMTPHNRLLDPMYQAGWLTTQGRFGPQPTHGDRAIDYIWWHKEPDRVNVRNAWTVKTGSDHRALLAEFSVVKRGAAVAA